MHNRRK